MVTRIAKCTCGQLQIAVEGEPLGVHCFACQSRTGSVFAALAAFGPQYTVTGRATDYVRTGDKGAKFRFRFCPVCGSNLYHTEEGEEHRSVAGRHRRLRRSGFPATRSLRLRQPPAPVGAAA